MEGACLEGVEAAAVGDPASAAVCTSAPRVDTGDCDSRESADMRRSRWAACARRYSWLPASGSSAEVSNPAKAPWLSHVVQCAIGEVISLSPPSCCA